jgi:hypothetical protein
MTTASATTPRCTIAVVFPNGYHTTNENTSANFTVSINISNPPVGVGYYQIAVGWNTSALSLKTGTSSDIVEGSWMDHFGSTLWAGPKINTTGGTVVVPDGLLSNASGAIGNGTMFTVAFHAVKLSPMANIAILGPNTSSGSYLLNGTLTGEVMINATVNGTVTVIPEFPASALLPLFLVTATIAIAAATVTSRKRRIPSRIS